MKQLLFLIMIIPCFVNAQSRYNTIPESQPYISTHVSPDFDAIQRAGQYKQQQDALEEQKYEMMVVQCKQQMTSYYSSLTTYKQVNSGWHKVYVLSVDNSLCETRYVYVENNKITTYMNGESKELSIANTFPIVNAKTMIELIIPEEANSLNTVYFFQ